MNSTSKFNVGDKVRVVEAPKFEGSKRFIGKQLVVREIVGDLAGGNVHFEGFNDCVLGADLELVGSATPKLTKKRRIEALEKDVARQETEIEELRAKIEAFEQKAKSADWLSDAMQKATSSYDNPSAADIIASLHGGEIVEVNGQPMFVKTSLTPNQRRAQIIADANGFVEQTIEDARYEDGDIVVPDPSEIENPWLCSEIKFEINAEKRTVVALAIGFCDDKVCEKAVAKCAPDDVFNADIGKAIAVGRLFGLDVERFINAPKPDKKAVGQLIEIEGNFRPYVDKVISGDSGSFHDVDNPETPIAILDDTEAQYE